LFNCKLFEIFRKNDANHLLWKFPLFSDIFPGQEISCDEFLTFEGSKIQQEKP